MTAFAYVVFVPRKYEINSPRFRRFLQLASERRINVLFSSMNSNEFDAGMRSGLAAERIFEHRQHRPFHSAGQVWILGGGCSAYAREVIRLALSPQYAIPVRHLTPEGSCLSRYVRMLQGDKEKIREEVGKGEVIRLSR
ncbi:hypothetical protein COU14_00435 [Candidatus Kaiserbacteria bacterium CG10_big_fil_rev_8_21_14_0_10_44_10]|uniref:Uncharacterized protein n=1 Tax=Candidatus Kaiserbacteria bacterium CG10_big_fil_rev_8_21_14_0_10_44_10 TaxID=1974606 RepID=A0A2H0UKF3_9BACT|nr:MAG: hypothetical protein COU14_00435 [Candidatus Kaiserbacteria bacterium CG10_big_fil_rev_8_21_14_0_10_44_10]